MDSRIKRPMTNKLVGFFITLIVFTIAITTMSYTASADTKLGTDYHVYLDDTYLGIVSDKSIVDQAIEQSIDGIKEQYPNLKLKAGNELTYITEQVFRSRADNEQVTSKLKDGLTIVAETVALASDDQTLVYVKDKAEAELTLQKMKFLYVTEEELAQVEAAQAADQELPALADGESRVLDVKIDEDVNFHNDVIDPAQILSADEAVTLLEKGTLKEETYVVKEGDVLGKIAAAYDLTSEELIELNEGLTEDSVIKIGQELNVTVTKPLLHVIVEQEAYNEETVNFAKEVVENDSMPKGETKVTQEGKNGKSGFTYKIIKQNGQQMSKEVTKEATIEEPVTEVIQKGTKVIPSRGSGSLAWPANGGYISSHMGNRWGKLHKGIDIARPSNYTIKAADNGVVVSAGWDNGGYGNKIVIDHQNGMRTVYAHLDSVGVSAGQTVEKGAAIGVMGSTGQSTGVHLHFEVYKNGKLENPMNHF
ncbi:M23 family metallopeptidase [Bacillus sp. FJAT-50079]|uniref:M23 family metallopeptidase n=1 Tax=Bacillus sp. FJAT-50079 TaxID=2833577 RepID=UPI001BC909C5|nr:M23 family metallopeptidase [Bacillus sp. FJAT-50079]MBS4207138.1 M23 family metallopeptidase [Bacillus sp. FJAT-50079]